MLKVAPDPFSTPLWALYFAALRTAISGLLTLVGGWRRLGQTFPAPIARRHGRGPAGLQYFDGSPERRRTGSRAGVPRLSTLG